MQRQRWRLIETGRSPAAWNMAVDEALLRRGTGLPVFRLYSWPAALSIGRFQKPSRTLDLTRLQNTACEWVRRPSGGGVLVHGDDLSYSIIMPKDQLRDLSVKKGYRRLCGFLLRTYAGLGLQASFVQESGLEMKTSDVCLAGREAYDIVVEGEKLGGNAQRHTRDTLLQHGTVPMQIDSDRFEPFFLEPSALQQSASLCRFGVSTGYEDLGTLMVESFEQEFGAELVEAGLSEAEQALAQRLYDEKYSTGEWNRDGHAAI